MKSPSTYFLKYLSASIGALILSIGFLKTTYKSKNEFYSKTGSVKYVSLRFKELPYRDFLKYRYLKIDGYGKPFELYVGKDPGDFTPALDQIDGLKPGDLVAVYFEQNAASDKDSVNRKVSFIDKNNKPVFIESPAKQKMAWALVVISAVCIGAVFVMEFNKKKPNRVRQL